MNAVELNNLLGQIKTHKITFSVFEICPFNDFCLQRLLAYCDEVTEKYTNNDDEVECQKVYKGIVEDFGLVEMTICKVKQSMINLSEEDFVEGKEDRVKEIEIKIKNVGDENIDYIKTLIKSVKAYCRFTDVEVEFGKKMNDEKIIQRQKNVEEGVKEVSDYVMSMKMEQKYFPILIRSNKDENYGVVCIDAYANADEYREEDCCSINGAELSEMNAEWYEVEENGEVNRLNKEQLRMLTQNRVFEWFREVIH